MSTHANMTCKCYNYDTKYKNTKQHPNLWNVSCISKYRHQAPVSE